MKEQHRFVSRFKIRVCHFSLVGLIILTQIQLGTAQADWADQAFASFKSPLDYPRLADVDRKKTQQDVNQDNKGNKKPTQRPGKFYSNEPRKPKQETGKVYEHRDFKSQEYRDKHRVWSTKDKKRRYRYYRHPGSRHYYPIISYPSHHGNPGVVIVRPLRHRRHYYPQYSHYPDDHYWGWLSSTAISLAILDNLNEHQHREHELALFNATRAPLGETITWSDGSVTGAVTATKEGTSSMGRYCREFQHQVTIGGKSELLYGTACRNPDGSWQIVQ